MIPAHGAQAIQKGDQPIHPQTLSGTRPDLGHAVRVSQEPVPGSQWQGSCLEVRLPFHPERNARGRKLRDVAA